MKKIITLLFVVAFVNPLVKAQVLEPQQQENQKVFEFGEVLEIESESLNENRVINVHLPDGYLPNGEETYPVIYVLDGSYNEDFPHIAGLVQFMNMYQLLPKSIVVGIANVDRYRDFTYPSSVKRDLKDIPTSGGSESFIRFIENELQPTIAKQFKTNGNNMLVGQSLGGLLATEILMTKPDLFNDYIIVSPSLWWDNEKLVNKTEKYFKEYQSLDKRVFISLGKEHPIMHKVADQLVNAMRSSGNDNLKVKYEPILGEDHATILHLAAYKAFKWMGTKQE